MGPDHRCQEKYCETVSSAQSAQLLKGFGGCRRYSSHDPNTAMANFNCWGKCSLLKMDDIQKRVNTPKCTVYQKAISLSKMFYSPKPSLKLASRDTDLRLPATLPWTVKLPINSLKVKAKQMNKTVQIWARFLRMIGFQSIHECGTSGGSSPMLAWGVQ